MNEDTQKFDRGSVLSIFGSDRKEDMMALLIALALTLAIYLIY
jgi:hypothetical protein